MLSTVNFFNKLLRFPDKRLQSNAADILEKPICIIGDGDYGLALASVMKRRASKVDIVKLPLRTPSHNRSSVPCKRKAEAKYSDSVTRLREMVIEPQQGIAEAEYVIFPGETNNYDGYILFVQRYLREGQNLLLVDAPIGAGLEFSKLLKATHGACTFNVGELDDIFCGINIEGDKLTINPMRARANLAGNTRNQQRKNLGIDKYLPVELIPSSNAIERGLCEVERILRPALLLFASLGKETKLKDTVNISKCIGHAETFLFLRRLESELSLVGKAYKLIAPSLASVTDAVWSGRAQNEAAAGRSFETAIDSYFSRLAESISAAIDPFDYARVLVIRDLTEHVAVLLELAAVASVRTPTLRAMLDLGSEFAKFDIFGKARTLASLGINSLDVNEILEVVNA